MVRLKDECNLIKKESFTNFNSSMVRLKGVRTRDPSRSQQQFQFQYGAIEGKIVKLHGACMLPFQFQYGAIEGIE